MIYYIRFSMGEVNFNRGYLDRGGIYTYIYMND